MCASQSKLVACCGRLCGALLLGGGVVGCGLRLECGDALRLGGLLATHRTSPPYRFGSQITHTCSALPSWQLSTQERQNTVLR